MVEAKQTGERQSKVESTVDRGYELSRSDHLL
jgi:hypothetical protein